MRILWLGIALMFLVAPRQSLALVTAAVGGHAGEVDANLRVTLERGKIEPNENPDSWQEASWEMYTVGAGYTVGTIGAFQDLFVRLEYNFYNAQAEVVSEVPGLCPNDLSGGRCEIHPEDRGSLISPQLGFNLIHEPNFSFGLYLQGQIPVSVAFDKFVLPRTDLIGGGTAVGVRLAPWLTYESRTFFGSGPLNAEQNATLAIVNLFGFHAKRWLLPWKAGIRVGPYFDGDLTERFDTAYDDAFFAGVPRGGESVVSSPEETEDRIRMMRFGVILAPYFNLTEQLAVEGNLTQKVFGYDTPATRFISFGLRGAF